ncbi:MAG: hypothetical protein HYY04_08390 [Chloroflexi bacterium]|nr:hypothetical protein [Chloroflexota bacterium]
MAKRIAFTLMLVAGLILASVSPALANNDPTVPADECSGNPAVVGQPPDPFGAVNATDIVDIVRGVPNPVDAAASRNNPGVSTGAKGQLKASASPGRCTENP